jgi:hypothetical protein
MRTENLGTCDIKSATPHTAHKPVNITRFQNVDVDTGRPQEQPSCSHTPFDRADRQRPFLNQPTPVSVNQFLNRADRANHNPLRYRTNRPQKPQQRLQRPQRMKRRVALSTPISQEQLSLSFAKRLNIETTRGHPPAHMREQTHLIRSRQRRIATPAQLLNETIPKRDQRATHPNIQRTTHRHSPVQ